MLYPLSYGLRTPPFFTRRAGATDGNRTRVSGGTDRRSDPLSYGHHALPRFPNAASPAAAGPAEALRPAPGGRVCPPGPGRCAPPAPLPCSARGRGPVSAGVPARSCASSRFGGWAKEIAPPGCGQRAGRRGGARSRTGPCVTRSRRAAYGPSRSGDVLQVLPRVMDAAGRAEPAGAASAHHAGRKAGMPGAATGARRPRPPGIAPGPDRHRVFRAVRQHRSVSVFGDADRRSAWIATKKGAAS